MARKEPRVKSNLLPVFLLACAAMAPTLGLAQEANAQSPAPAPLSTPIVYHNTQYGFCFLLPADWKGFSVVTTGWSGNEPGTEKIMRGPAIRLRNPAWTEADPYQDIPIMVFTQAQWREKEKNGLIVSAAGVDLDAMGRNARYVFAQPPRWVGYADVKGWREVEDLMMTHPFQAPCAKSKASAAK
jgi:hypothetical protein